MRHEIIKKVEEVRQELSEIYGIHIEALPIEFTLKGRTSGRCTYHRKYEFNLQIARDNEGFLESTVPHEVAHQAAVQIYGWQGKGHGAYWKRVMRSLGITPKRCSTYKNIVAARKTKRYTYQCGCGKDLLLSNIRYNRAIRGQTQYGCRCGRSINMTKAILKG